MERMIITRAGLKKWLERIKAHYDLYAPVRSTVVNFDRVERVEGVCLDFTNTFLPPKALFFPQSEELFSYTRDGGGIEVKVGEAAEGVKKKRVLFGIRPCDVRALSILDKVFGGEYEDSYYLEKRRKTALIGIGCVEPRNSCFCSTFGIDPLSGEGTDVFLIDHGGRFTLKEVNTKRGRALVRLGDALFKKERAEKREVKIPETARIDIAEITGNIEKVSEDFWNNTSDPCLSCGICTYVCPTCHCFDVEDEEKKSGGSRYRTWDFCMNKDFASMASGENPRATKGERYRHRYFHKFSHFPKKYEVMGCVGCGRCISHCPVNSDIRRVLEEIQE